MLSNLKESIGQNNYTRNKEIYSVFMMRVQFCGTSCVNIFYVLMCSIKLLTTKYVSFTSSKKKHDEFREDG